MKSSYKKLLLNVRIYSVTVQNGGKNVKTYKASNYQHCLYLQTK